MIHLPFMAAMALHRHVQKTVAKHAAKHVARKAVGVTTAHAAKYGATAAKAVVRKP